MTSFVTHVLDGYKAGEIAKEQAVHGLVHVMEALEARNYAEAAKWSSVGQSECVPSVQGNVSRGLFPMPRSGAKPHGDWASAVCEANVSRRAGLSGTRKESVPAVGARRRSRFATGGSQHWR